MDREPSSSAEILDGKAVAAEITAKIAVGVEQLAARGHRAPGLAVVLVGEDAASQVYVGAKGRKAKELGFHSVQYTLPADTAQDEVLALVAALNSDAAIDGILVQLPLPAHIDSSAVLESIDPAKDVDGFHPINVGRLAVGERDRALVSCTPAGCLILIKRALPLGLAGLDAVVIGRSNIVGKPMAQLLLQESCTVTIAHSRSRDLPAIVRRADIVVAAVGRAEMVRGDWVKPGAVVVDVGMNRIAAPERGEGKTRLVGDIAFAEAVPHARAITPVPGGVGPMTIAMLMANTLIAACRAAGQEPPQF
ncbi:bifunctional methylenetetrahydrofolate dehydrogenase/methenyltetrahydrofolate cyclohydrolase FolD [Kaistia algarum]|uniref:bifunctional methylenetetrahydrofolate dehydrogenase/methenyltetrahydrofolate cyclohydrolase FolD n=1 Tax=Kaistia algarum TaxID=2083279 RepID=UPI000CE790E2|nr:bifunctional methylenetetrahydrofolate dehydrogenase/methenyltetrahydrofolate cyclohydrolase FolD [Kaistia algarum]MCX5516155.1 bifunctional methylenetetrahydrofolate dehydrogenase/methenyltetrahydrofolate cyclohydrolase FolD [Kaistia algarum]PPE78229.1 bifunctional methylenetetrahydrofolate dehydrogenase/methenyltetrahydrofolate cyclohydrolase FolD [Kaistia algarum]